MAHAELASVSACRDHAETSDQDGRHQLLKTRSNANKTGLGVMQSLVNGSPSGTLYEVEIDLAFELGRCVSAA